MSRKQTAIPCVLMRGGTSKGPFFHAKDLPRDHELRARVLLAVMGSPDLRQINGIGGAETTTSKVAIVSVSQRPKAQIDYLFAQVSVDQAIVDTAPSCGNMLTGVGPLALEAGLLPITGDTTGVVIHNVNTGALIETIIQTPDGQVTYDGDTAIDGVPGAAAPVQCRYLDVVGSKTGVLLPSGRIKETIQGVEVSCLDVAMPMVIMRAADLGKSGYETKAELDADQALFARMESIRREAADRMGMGDVSRQVVPKLALIAEPRNGGSISSRYFVPHNCHAAHAVTGSLCVATCAVMAGTVADGLARVQDRPVQNIIIEHPMGKIEVELAVDGRGPELNVRYGAIVRTTRRLFEGRVLIPAAIWDGNY